MIDRVKDFAELIGGAESQPVSSRPKPKPTLEAEKIRLARAQAEKVEIQNATSRRELLRAADVEAEWTAIIRDLRAAFLALSTRIGQRLPHLSAKDLAAIDLEIRNTLADLSEEEKP